VILKQNPQEGIEMFSEKTVQSSTRRSNVFRSHCWPGTDIELSRRSRRIQILSFSVLSALLIAAALMRALPALAALINTKLNDQLALGGEVLAM
jgi:hypothetical protein